MEECSKFPTPVDVVQRMGAEDPFKSEDYFITSGQCAKCGRYGMMISEPNGSAYRCRECYTELTNEQIAAAFKRLGEMISGQEI